MQSYCVTKAGLDMALKCMKSDLANKEIFYGSLKPGIVDTPMLREIYPNIP